MTKFLFLITLFTPSLTFGAFTLEGSWVLSESTMTYHVTHLLKKTEGSTHSAKGKGKCDKSGECEFLVAAPVKTFDSGNSNRDLHMLEVVKGASFPMIVAHMKIHNNSGEAEIEFAGVKQTLEIKDIQVTDQKDKSFHVKLQLPIVLSQFKIERPSLVTVAIDDKTPVSIDATWVRQ